MAVAAYGSGVILAGAAVLAATWISATNGRAVGASEIAFWALLSLAAETFWLPTRSGGGMVSMGLMANAAAFLLLPAPLALSIIASSVFAADLMFHRRSQFRAAFNAAQTVLAMAAAGVCASLLGLSTPIDVGSALVLHPAGLIAFPAMFVILNVALVTGAISLELRARFLETWRENFGGAYHYWNAAVLYVLALGLGMALDAIGFMGGLVGLILLLVARDAYRHHLLKQPSTAPSR